jgi:transposase
MMGRINMSQLARKLGVDRETVRLWLKAKKIPEGKLERHPIYNHKVRTFSRADIEAVYAFMRASPHGHRGRKHRNSGSPEA